MHEARADDARGVSVPRSACLTTLLRARASAITALGARMLKGCRNPRLRHLGELFADCHGSDISEWLASVLTQKGRAISVFSVGDAH